MDKTPVSLGPINTGSLLNSSEGLLTTTLTGIAGTVVSGDYDPSVQMAAVLGLAVTVAAYCVSRGLAKKDAK
jgi:hypothetical protein